MLEYVWSSYMDHHLSARAVLWHNYEYSLYLYSHQCYDVTSLLLLEYDGQIKLVTSFELQGKH